MSKIHASAIIHRDRPCELTHPRAVQDPSARLRKYGKVLPMDEPGFFARLFAKVRP